MAQDTGPENEPLLSDGLDPTDDLHDLHDLLDAEAQDGVQQADATNLVWTKNTLIVAYCFIFLNFCVNSLQQQIAGNLFPYVVSNFSAHSLIPAIGIASQVLSGVLKLPMAKMIDTWGRPQGFVAMTALATLGLALMCICKNVETWAAAQVFYTVGHSGFSYILDIIIADTSSLKDRALAFAFANSPYIATTFAGPAAAQWFLQHSSWQTAFGLFAVLTPLVAVPVFVVLQTNANKAKKLGMLKQVQTDRDWSESFWHFAIEFDGMVSQDTIMYNGYMC